MSDCIFCKIVKREVKSEIVAEGDRFMAIKDAHPVVKGHTLIIPKKHLVTLLDIPKNMGEELLEFTKKIASQMLDDKQGDGFNLVMNNLAVAGQVVMHAHIHVVPRNEGDGLHFVVKK